MFNRQSYTVSCKKDVDLEDYKNKIKINELKKKTGMVMSIFIILRLVQCTCFALYVLWNKWSTVMVKYVVFISKQVDIKTNCSKCFCDFGVFFYIFF